MHNKQYRLIDHTIDELLKEFYRHYHSDIPVPTEEQKKYIMHRIHNHKRHQKIIKHIVIGSALIAAGILSLTSAALVEQFTEESEIGISIPLD